MNNEFLGTKPIKELVRKLSIPTITAQLINLLYNLVDRMYIGHMKDVGGLALTGVGVCLPLIIVIGSFAALICYGGAPRASIEMGKGNNDNAQHIMSNCFFAQVLVSIILTIVLLLFNEPILLKIGASPTTLPYALSYMNIFALGTIFIELSLGLNAFVTSQGFTNITMKTVLIGAIANIILDPIFIFVLDLKVEGAALASVLSQALSCYYVLKFLQKGDSLLRLNKQQMKLQSDILNPCLALGLSTFIMQISESIIAVVFNASLQKYGGDIAVGAMTIASSIMQLTILPLSGFGMGVQPIISYNFGKGNIKRVKEANRILIKDSFIYSTTFFVLVEAFPQFFVKPFTESGSALAVYTIPMMRIYLAIIGLFGIQIACQFIFNSLGNAKASIAVAVLRKFILLIPLIYLMPRWFSSDPTRSVFLAEPVADFISVTFTIILFLNQKEKMVQQKNERL